MPIAQKLVDLALQTPGLDAAADTLAGAVNGAFDAEGGAKQPLKDALNGTWLGHSLHPAITDVPIGAWTAALALDALGEPRGARIAIGVGLIGALGAAATGLTDWSDTSGKARRLGVVHAALNGAATLLYGASWLVRGNDRRSGVLLSALGYGIVSLSALYGGTLSLDLQIGVNRTSVPEPPAGEVDVAALAEVPDGGMKRVDANGYPVLLVRRGGERRGLRAPRRPPGRGHPGGRRRHVSVARFEILRAGRRDRRRSGGIPSARLSRSRPRRPRPRRGRGTALRR
jgi:uncharacterized membrane protein